MKQGWLLLAIHTTILCSEPPPTKKTEPGFCFLSELQKCYPNLIKTQSTFFKTLQREREEKYQEAILRQLPPEDVLESDIAYHAFQNDYLEPPVVEEAFARWFRLHGVAQAEGFCEYRYANFPFIFDAVVATKPIDSPPSIASLYASKMDRKGLDELVAQYKIHLMPPEEKLEETCIEVLQKIGRTLALKKLVDLLKFKLAPDAELNENGAPKIILYTSQGKDAAQQILDATYEHFHDRPGCGNTPWYNEKVTDFIFYAQGNRDEKKNDTYWHFFEQPQKVYYDAASCGMAGSDFHLRNPAHQKEGYANL